MEDQTIDPQRLEEATQKFVNTLNQGALALMISIGHRTGLFDQMAKMKPSTSEEIAKASHLNERYVRECLSALVVGDIIKYDAKNHFYSLPAEHAAFLTRPAAPHNLAAFSQFIPLLGSVEDQIVDCFKKGGGVPYSKYPRFQEVMAEVSDQTVVSSLKEAILPLAPDLVKKLEQGIEVLDVGCGKGHALNQMAKLFPKSHFTGFDISQEGVESAQRDAQKNGVKNIDFEVKDVSKLHEKAKFDLITAFDVIHDQAKPDVVLDVISKALKPSGTFLMQDIQGSSHLEENLKHPVSPLLYTISCMHCMTVSLADHGMGLGTMWGQQKAENMLHDAGFKDVKVHQLPHDFMNNFYLAQK